MYQEVSSDQNKCYGETIHKAIRKLKHDRYVNNFEENVIQG